MKGVMMPDSPAPTRVQPVHVSPRLPVLNALTVDIEDYYHVSAFEGHVSRAQGSHRESRVTASTPLLLDILDRHGVRGTFCVLGWVAEHYPRLIRAVADAGHEIGCHSYWHRLV